MSGEAPERVETVEYERIVRALVHALFAVLAPHLRRFLVAIDEFSICGFLEPSMLPVRTGKVEE